MEQSSDLARLREEFPGWEFQARWITAGSGPDVRVFEARREDVTVSAASTAELAEKVRERER